MERTLVLPCDFTPPRLFCSTATQFQQSLSVIRRDPRWVFSLPEQDFLEVTPILLCPYFPSGRHFLFSCRWRVRSCERRVIPCGLGAWDLSLTWCLCLRLLLCSSSRRLMMSGPQVAVLLCNTMACLFRTKDLFTRCQAVIRADSRANCTVVLHTKQKQS